MATITTFLRRGFLCMAMLLALSSRCGIAQSQPTAIGDERDLPPDIQVQLQKSADAMSSVALEYSKSQEGSVPSNYSGPVTYSARFDAGRFYQRRESPAQPEGKRRLHEDSFEDGVFYFGDPEIPVGDSPATLVKYLVADSADPERNSNLIDVPYLNSAGFYFSKSIAGLVDPRVDSLVLRYLKESTRTEVEETEGGKYVVTVTVSDPVIEAAKQVDLPEYKKHLEAGRNSPDEIAKEVAAMKSMQQMTPQRKIALTLDPKYGYGVTKREEWTAAGEQIVEVIADQWKHFENAGVWLPQKCTESYYTYPSGYSSFTRQPMLTYSLRLKHANFSHQKDFKYALDYKRPGTLVVDRTTVDARQSPGHQVSYEVSADGSELRRSGKAAFQEIHGRTKNVWLWVNVAVVFIVACLLFYRRFARGASKA